MDVMIIATKACTHLENLEKELEHLRISYHVCFVEDCADLVQKFNIQHSPNLVVDDEVVFRKQPSEVELRAYFDTRHKADPELRAFHQPNFRSVS